MADGPVILSVVFTAAEGRADELQALLEALVPPTRAEAGCIGYNLSISTETPGNFLLYEQFKSQAALDEHIAMPHFQHFVKTRESGSDPVANVTVQRWTPLI